MASQITERACFKGAEESQMTCAGVSERKIYTFHSSLAKCSYFNHLTCQGESSGKYDGSNSGVRPGWLPLKDELALHCRHPA